MSQPATFWQKYGTLAQMAQASVALLGFVAILFQINELRSNNRATSARTVFLAYTDLAFKNPELGRINQIIGRVDGQKLYLNFLKIRPGIVIV